MKRSVVIIGKSGHGSVIAQSIQDAGDWVFGWLDDDLAKANETLGVIADAPKFSDHAFVIGIGDNQTRQKVAEKLAGNGLMFYTAIHPSAVIADTATIGEGTVIMANAVVNPGARIGKHCIINTAAVVEHDCTIGEYVHLSPAVALGGGVEIGDLVHFGIGSTAIHSISVCARSTIGAGAVVVKPITKPGTYIGIPARKLR